MKSSLKFVWKKKNFFVKRNIAFLSWIKIYFILEDMFFKIPKNIFTSEFFLPRQILKNKDMPWQKRQILHWKNSLTESLKIIMWLIVQRFSVSDLNMAKQAVIFGSPQHDF